MTMSQNIHESERDSDADGAQDTDYTDAIESFTTATGVSSPDIHVDGDNDTFDEIADIEHEREYDPTVTGRRFVELYDSRDRFIREFLNNAETACYVRAILGLADHSDEYDEDDLADRWEFRDVMAEASEVLGYSPSIYVRRSHDDADHALVIEDNGCGVAIDQYRASKDVGLSAWHGISGSNGMFGQGKMSGFLGCGVYSKFCMITRDVVNDDSWGLEERIDKPLERPWTRAEDDYGTVFFWPSFSDQTENDVDVADSVAEYARGLRVPVVYEEYDSDGVLVDQQSEEYGPTFMEDRLPDHAPTVVVDTTWERAVWSPEIGNGYSADYTPMTLNVAQPTDRNDGYGSPDNYDMPGPWDLRVKREAPNGYVRHVPEDASLPDGYENPSELVGQQPIERGKYTNRKQSGQPVDGFVPESDLPDGTICTPAVTGDRDRFTNSSRVQDYCEFVSQQLYDRFRERTAEVFEQIDDFQDVFALDDDELDVFLRGASRFGPTYASTDPQTMAEHYEDELGVSIDPDVCEQIDDMNTSVSWASRGTRTPQTKEYRSDTKIWKIMERAGSEGTVYMASRIGQRKAHLAWELHENNQVVQVKRRDQHEYASTYGWESLIDLPVRGFAEAFPDHDFDEDFLDRWDKSRASSTGPSGSGLDTGSGSFDDERAKQRQVEVRYDAGSAGVTSTITGVTLFDRLDAGESFGIGTYEFDTLVLYGPDNTVRVGTHIGDTSAGVAYAVVPNYVHDYLIEAQNAYTEDGYLESLRTQWVDVDWHEHGRSGESFDTLGDRDVFLYTSDEYVEPFETHDCMDGLREHSADAIDVDQSDGIRSLTIITSIGEMGEYKQQLHRNGLVADDITGPTIVGMGKTPGYGYTPAGRIEHDDVFFDVLFPTLDRDASEWSALNPSPSDSEPIELVESIAETGGFASNDPTVDVPDDAVLDRAHVSTAQYYLMETLERAHAGGSVGDDDSDGDGDR
jgi:hypothetical protein